MSSNIELNIDNLRESKTPLYHRFEGRSHAQYAWVEMTEDGVVHAGINWESGGTTHNAHHLVDIRWNVSPNVRGSALAELLESEEAQALLERIYDGHSTEWPSYGQVGQLDEDAEEASNEFASLLADCETIEIFEEADAW